MARSYNWNTYSLLTFISTLSHIDPGPRLRQPRLLSVGADGGGYTSLCTNKDDLSLSTHVLSIFIGNFCGMKQNLTELQSQNYCHFGRFPTQ